MKGENKMLKVRNEIIVGCLLLAAFAPCRRVLADSDVDLARYVDIFTGTAATGHTHPAASYPFGMLQAGPDTGRNKWAYCSGYQFADQSVLGYSQNHLSGTGCPDYGDVQILPFSGELRALPMESRIDKTSEVAEPGYYSVYQGNDGVKVEIAAARKAAIYRFKWNRGRQARVLINLPFGQGNLSGSFADVRTRGLGTLVEDGRVISGLFERKGWIKRRLVGFALEFDRPWTSIERLPDAIKGEPPRYVLAFDLANGEPLQMKIALSMKSAAGARRNLRTSIPGWDFQSVRQAARARWNNLFAAATCEGSEEMKKNWYTALYHLYLQPNDWSDDGEELYFTTLSLWDTFRAAQPWYTIMTPEIVVPIIDSMLAIWKREGRLPVMSYGGQNVDCMIGNHAAPVIADAYLKGFRGFDVDEAFVALTNTLSVAHPGKPKENWDQYLKYGYFPLDLNKGEGASRTLECAYDDWCAAKFFEAIRRTAAAAEYARRAENWRNVFDASVGFARGKDTKGRWREPFDPFALAHEDDWPSDFTEGNAWQYTWHVMQDPEGLIAGLGGKAKAAEKLESLFHQESVRKGAGFVSDVSGLIGQYAHGNEPSHHVIYLFQYMNRPDLAAVHLREVFDTQYHTGPEGLCGNDDCGQMSAWYLFSAMGFYPFNPCGGDYVIGAPQVPKATLTLQGGRVFTMTARNLSKENRFVKSVTLNGRPLDGFSIRHEDILKGGELVFEMEKR